jgi:hypothetical protein
VAGSLLTILPAPPLSNTRGNHGGGLSPDHLARPPPAQYTAGSLQTAKTIVAGSLPTILPAPPQAEQYTGGLPPDHFGWVHPDPRSFTGGNPPEQLGGITPTTSYPHSEFTLKANPEQIGFTRNKLRLDCAKSHTEHPSVLYSATG